MIIYRKLLFIGKPHSLFQYDTTTSKERLVYDYRTSTHVTNTRWFKCQNVYINDPYEEIEITEEEAFLTLL
jgi:hypothetical protein